MQFNTLKRGGYDPIEVDKYIATLEQVIKSYKDKDNAIKNAIIGANVAAENIVENSKQQANEFKRRINTELVKLKEEITRQRMRVQVFQEVYSGLIKKYLHEMSSADFDDLYGRLDETEKTLDILMEESIYIPNFNPSDVNPPMSSDAVNPPPAQPQQSHENIEKQERQENEILFGKSS